MTAHVEVSQGRLRRAPKSDAGLRSVLRVLFGDPRLQKGNRAPKPLASRREHLEGDDVARKTFPFFGYVSVGAVKKLRLSLLGDSLAAVVVGCSGCRKLVNISHYCVRNRQISTTFDLFATCSCYLELFILPYKAIANSDNDERKLNFSHVDPDQILGEKRGIGLVL